MSRCIVETAGTCAGRPRLEGTRITVERIVRAFKDGMSPASVAAEYGLETGDVHNALRFHLNQQARRRRRMRGAS